MKRASHTIDIWHIALNTPSPPLHLLSPDELTRYHRFYFENHRLHFAHARVALRTILAHYLTCTPQDIIFEYEAYGKPQLKTGNLHFNLTHSKHLALLAISSQYPIGIDIELFSKRPYHELAVRIFSEKERQDLSRLPTPLLPLGFFSLWSQKESLIKACGLGLSYPLETLTFPAFPQKETVINEPIQRQTWKISPFMPYPATCAAVCYHPSIQTIRHFDYDATLCQ